MYFSTAFNSITIWLIESLTEEETQPGSGDDDLEEEESSVSSVQNESQSHSSLRNTLTNEKFLLSNTSPKVKNWWQVQTKIRLEIRKMEILRLIMKPKKMVFVLS